MEAKLQTNLDDYRFFTKHNNYWYYTSVSGGFTWHKCKVDFTNGFWYFKPTNDYVQGGSIPIELSTLFWSRSYTHNIRATETTISNLIPEKDEFNDLEDKGDLYTAANITRSVLPISSDSEFLKVRIYGLTIIPDIPLDRLREPIEILDSVYNPDNIDRYAHNLNKDDITKLCRIEKENRIKFIKFQSYIDQRSRILSENFVVVNQRTSMHFPPWLKKSLRQLDIEIIPCKVETYIIKKRNDESYYQLSFLIYLYQRRDLRGSLPSYKYYTLLTNIVPVWKNRDLENQYNYYEDDNRYLQFKYVNFGIMVGKVFEYTFQQPLKVPGIVETRIESRNYGFVGDIFDGIWPSRSGYPGLKIYPHILSNEEIFRFFILKNLNYIDKLRCIDEFPSKEREKHSTNIPRVFL
jgi:hypothetical protein